MNAKEAPVLATSMLLAATTPEVSVALATKTSPATDSSVLSMTSAPPTHATPTLLAATVQLVSSAHVVTDTKVDYLFIFTYIYFNHIYFNYNF